MLKRIFAVVLVIFVLSAFVSCKKEKGDEGQSSGQSSNSSTWLDEDYDPADDLTSSEFAAIESEFTETVKPEIEIPGVTSSAETSSGSVSSNVTSSDSASSSDNTSSAPTSSDSGWTGRY